MRIGIIGLERSGKTTVFNALTGANKAVGTYGKTDTNISVVKIPDERMDWLTNAYQPKKIVHAVIEFVDIPGGINDSSDPKIVAAARETDALVYVVRSFENPEVDHPSGNIDPVKDLGSIQTGLTVADMIVAEKRLEKLRKTRGKGASPSEKEELEILEKVMARLELEKPLSTLDLTPREEKAIRSFQFLTLKPSMVLLNVSDKGLHSPDTKKLEETIDNCISMCANTEMEIQTLDPEDRQAFLDDLGIKELTLNRFILKAYSTLGLISFFTAGENEVHAWTVKKGSTALAAAGKIHSDLERGFIRAEVFNYDDLRSLGSEREIKNAGKFRLEGKEYIVRDGDVLVIKFSV